MSFVDDVMKQRGKYQPISFLFDTKKKIKMYYMQATFLQPDHFFLLADNMFCSLTLKF